MITATKKKRIIRAFGTTYTPELLRLLKTAKIKTATGKPFSQSSLRQLVCGIRSNEKAEEKIMELVENKIVASKTKKAKP